MKQIDIVKQLQMIRGTISKIIKKNTECCSCTTRPRSGRPKKITPIVERYIKRLSAVNSRASATHICKEIVEQNLSNISVRTVQRRLNDAGLFGRHPARKPLISEENRKKRLDFAKKHLH
ncbi:hypothetical protein ILUMI_08600 [Ignelater luminosus]|uniref:Transposase Tc1-like domain-containing protein n=1 Tax=Ignelater luminosus TaxID=2038154 RepID=A0A8K0D431_IGNLU|nr:hypothetical protein ILUMI_08600 [Ignelater luminosus]